MAFDQNDRRRRRENDESSDDDLNQGGDSGQRRPPFRRDRNGQNDDAADDDAPRGQDSEQSEYGPPAKHSHKSDDDQSQDADFRPSKEVWSPSFSSHPLGQSRSEGHSRPESQSHSHESDDSEDRPHRRRSSDDDYDDDNVPLKRHSAHPSGPSSSHTGHSARPAYQPVASNSAPLGQASPYVPRPAGPIIPSSILAHAAAITSAGSGPATTSPDIGSSLSSPLSTLGGSPAGLAPSTSLFAQSGSSFDKPLSQNPYALTPDHHPMVLGLGAALAGSLFVIGGIIWHDTQKQNDRDPRNAPGAAFQQVAQTSQMNPLPQFQQAQMPMTQTQPSFPQAQPQQVQAAGDATDLMALQDQLKGTNNQVGQLQQQLNQQQLNHQQELARQQQEFTRKQQQALDDQSKQLAQSQQREVLRFQQQNQQQSQDSLQKKYVTDIRLAAQAWERGDTNQVLQLISPYRTPEMRQQFNSFAANYLWRAAHNGSSSTLRGHTECVRHAVFFPDGSRVATLSDDATIRIWDAQSGAPVSSFPLDAPPPPAGLGGMNDQLGRHAGGLVMASNGTWVAAYGQILYFGTSLGQSNQPRRVTDHMAPITAVAVSPRGDMVASGDMFGKVLIHRMDGSSLLTLPCTRPQALAFSPDGRFLYGGMQDGGMFVWDTTTGAPQGTANFGDGINSIAVSRDGSIVAVALAVRDGVVRLWDPTTGKVRSELRGHHDEVTHVAYSSDGQSLLTSSRDQTACLWNNTGGLLRAFRGHIADVETVAFSPDGQKVVSAGDDRTAILWNVDGGQACDVLADSPVDGWVSGFAFTPDAQLVGTGSCDNNEAYLTEWNLASNMRNKPYPLQTSSKAGVALAFSPDYRQMVVGESSPKETTVRSRVRFWSLEPTRVTASYPPAVQQVSGLVGTGNSQPKLMGAIQSAEYSPDGRYVAMGFGDIDERFPASVKIFYAGTGMPQAQLPETYGRSQAYFTPDGQFLVSVTTSNKRPGDIRVWSLAKAQAVSQFTVPQGLENMIAGALSPDGRFLVTSHGDLVNPQSNMAAPNQPGRLHLRIWDLQAQRIVGEFPAEHSAPIKQIVFSRLGKILATGDMAGTVRVWDFATRQRLPRQIPRQPGEISCLAFDRLGNRLITGADEKMLHVWNVDTAAPLADLGLALGKPTAARFSEDSRTIAGATSAGGLFFWDATGNSYQPRSILRGEGNPAGSAGHGGVITCIAGPLSDGRYLTGSTDKSVKLWDMHTRAVADKSLIDFKQSIMCMALAPNRRNVVVGTGRYKNTFEPGQLVLCPMDGQQVQILRKDVAIANVAYSPDGTMLAVCSLSPDVGQIVRRDASLIDLQSGQSYSLQSKLPQSITFSPDGRLVAIGCTDGRVELWPIGGNASTGNALGGNNLSGYAGGLTSGSIPSAPWTVLQGHRGMVSVVAFAPDGRTLATGGADNNVVLWDVPTCQDMITFKHNGTVEGLKFSMDGTLLATADREPTRGGVRLWRGTVDDSALDNAPGLSSPAISAGAANIGIGRDPNAAIPAAANPGYPPPGSGSAPGAGPMPGERRGPRRPRGNPSPTQFGPAG